jgi:hypothetical protein
MISAVSGCASSSNSESKRSSAVAESYATTTHNLEVLGNSILSAGVEKSGSAEQAWRIAAEDNSHTSSELRRLARNAASEAQDYGEMYALAAASMRPGPTRAITRQLGIAYSEKLAIYRDATRARIDGDTKTFTNEIRSLDEAVDEISRLNRRLMALPNVRRFYAERLAGENR